MGKPIIDINGATREMTDAEYDVYLAGQEQEPELTDIEKLKIRQSATEDAILFLMDMGGML